MLLSSIWSSLAQITTVPVVDNAFPSLPIFQFSKEWSLLGPFQIGTREAVWGADPLEHFGGFRSLTYDPNAVFRSSLPVNGTTGWFNVTAQLTKPSVQRNGAALSVEFQDVDWESLRNVYGWAAYQWQAWIRGEIYVQSNKTEIYTLSAPQVLEWWIDAIHYFGGDFYDYSRAPPLLHLTPGIHRIDIRIVRDVRAFGGIEKPSMNISLRLDYSYTGLKHVGQVLISDTINSASGQGLASPFGSALIRNDGDGEVIISAVEATHNACLADLWLGEELRIAPGQTRPVAFRVRCVRLDWRIRLDFKFRVASRERIETLTVLAEPTRRNPGEPHKVTFPHPGGIVSYAILRPPSRRAVDAVQPNATLPVLLGFHGAGVEAEWDSVRLALQPLPDLPAWVLFPTGVTPWAGDDWHAFGFPDVEAAVEMIPDWIEVNEWQGPGVDTQQWLVAGHSNGGQGVWHALTHWPDKVIAASPISGYSSIQNYVPYTFWQPSDPVRTSIIQSGLLPYRHELLLANAKGIPVLQQHGGADDNVPPYHSRLQSQLIREAGAESEYFEFPGKPHWWDGVFTTAPLKDFYQQQIDINIANVTKAPITFRDFSLVVANPGDTGSKHGFRVLNLINPGQIGRLEVSFDPTTLACLISTANVRMFYVPPYFRDCSFVTIDRQEISVLGGDYQSDDWNLELVNGTWDLEAVPSDNTRPIIRRMGSQLGQMDSILRTRGPFQILQHSEQAHHIALQISRNLCQYFAADTIISKDWDEAFTSTGNIISVAIGNDLPKGYFANHPIQIEKGKKIHIRHFFGNPGNYEDFADLGLAAIFLRPLPMGRLELVVWGSDASMLEVAARLVPMMPGSGQPDFVVMDKTMLAKGLEGVLAMGFFDNFWEVSKNSFFG
ncbi:putative secreted protein [Pseudocercospora fuligena]|uniref:Putative secreted protein n=1 Tax=Pseudocercospora fuligena TaxID=685502 RepID=A0A8H6RSV8_9PEZI|nr:putative secreted protein [Pseudocercospora fuligena]